jgi:ATP-dependent DNA helicase DinG
MLTLKAQPIHPRTLLPKALFEQVPVVMLSATLTTNRSFDFIAERLGLIDYEEVIISSPFDYRNRVLLVLSETAPDPGKAPKAYERFLIQGLERVLRLTGGRTLVLFTSYRLMGLVAEGLKEWLKQSDIQLLIQEEGNREWMIQQFKENPRSVMFGCDTFWEGIDIPGDALSCVVITKLPFANPQEPVVKAKVHSIDRSGGNSFTGFMVPSAMIKLKQGFGRLIRQEGDRGVVVVMDSRVIRMPYGQRFIDNLPPARKGYLKEIADYVPKK